MYQLLRHTSTKRLCVLAAALALAACSSDSSTAPTSNPVDLSAALSAASLSGISGALGQVSTASAASASAPAVVPGNCAYSATSSSFNCPTVTFNGLTFTRSYILYDASNHAQSAYDKSTTAAVKLISAETGTMTMPSGNMMSMTGSIAMNGHDTTTISGLLTGKLVMDGVSVNASQGSMTMNGTTTPFTMNMTQKTSGLALPPVGTQPAYPLAGTITMDVTSTYGSGSTAFSGTEHMSMKFDGSSIVTMTMTFSGLTQTCKIDLSRKSPMACS